MLGFRGLFGRLSVRVPFTNHLTVLAHKTEEALHVPASMMNRRQDSLTFNSPYSTKKGVPLKLKFREPGPKRHAPQELPEGADIENKIVLSAILRRGLQRDIAPLPASHIYNLTTCRKHSSISNYGRIL